MNSGKLLAMPIWLQILVTAAFSGIFTLLTAYLLFRWVWRPSLEREIEVRVEARLETALHEMEERLETLGDRLRERLGETVEQRVRSGVVAAVQDLPSSDLVKNTTRSVARTGAELLGEGLNALLGGRGRREESEE